MGEFVKAFEFIAHNGAIAGQPGLPSLTVLTLETLKVAAIGVAISVAIALPVGVWLGHVHRGSFFAINLGNIGRALPSQFRVIHYSEICEITFEGKQEPQPCAIWKR